MATIEIDPKEAVFYNPDGVNAPLTLLFPDTSNIPNGQRIKLINYSTSNTTVIYQAQGSDTIANPEEITNQQASHNVDTPELIIEYMAVGTEWRITGHGDPDLAKQVVALFVLAAYGGLHLSAAPVAFPDIDATWQKINVFDTASVFSPRLIVQNVANNSLQFAEQGVYRGDVVLSFEHDSANQGRLTYFRFYNETDGAPAGINYPIGIGRNAEASSITVPVLFEAGVGQINKDVILQLGGGDTILTVEFQAAEFIATGVGEFRGQLESY